MIPNFSFKMCECKNWVSYIKCMSCYQHVCCLNDVMKITTEVTKIQELHGAAHTNQA